jgi:hypothetical protein
MCIVAEQTFLATCTFNDLKTAQMSAATKEREIFPSLRQSHSIRQHRRVKVLSAMAVCLAGCDRFSFHWNRTPFSQPYSDCPSGRQKSANDRGKFQSLKA